jgi:hypothetical protein
MPQPAVQDVHVNRPLTNISVAYIQAADSFIASKVFPVVPVEKQTDLYYVYTKNDWFRDEAQIRVSGEESAGSGYGLSTASYSCDRFDLHKDVPYDVERNADVPLNPRADGTRFVTQRLLLRQEIQWAADCFGTSIWGTDVTPTNLWDNFSTSDPVGDVEVGIRTVLSNTGFKPNTLVLGYQVWEKLKQHPDLIDRIKYTQKGVITQEMVASLFGLDNVYVCQAVKATNAEGGTAAYSFVHGKHALLAYVAPSPSLLMPSAGYTFAWKGISQGLGENVGIYPIEMPWLDVVRIEGRVAFDNKIVATDLGYFFNGAVS